MKKKKQTQEITLSKDDLTKEQVQAILERTPDKYIYQRVGRGNTTLDYVSIGYVVKKLNRILVICTKSWVISLSNFLYYFIY